MPTKQNESKIESQLKKYDGTVRLFETALVNYFDGVVPECERPVLYVRSRGLAVYAIVCEQDEATRSPHADYYPLHTVVKYIEGQPYPLMDVLCKIAVKWVFCYMENLDHYLFAADMGKVLYFVEWIESAIYTIEGLSMSGSELAIIIKATSNNYFELLIGDKARYKETDRQKVYPYDKLYMMDTLLSDINSKSYYTCGCNEVNYRLLFRIGLEWVFGILQ